MWYILEVEVMENDVIFGVLLFCYKNCLLRYLYIEDILFRVLSIFLKKSGRKKFKKWEIKREK